MLDLGPDGSVYKESACNVGDLGLIPGLGRSPGEETSYLLQYSGLENSMDCRVHVVAKSRTGLSDFHVHFHLTSIAPPPESMTGTGEMLTGYLRKENLNN